MLDLAQENQYNGLFDQLSYFEKTQRALYDEIYNMIESITDIEDLENLEESNQYRELLEIENQYDLYINEIKSNPMYIRFVELSEIVRSYQWNYRWIEKRFEEEWIKLSYAYWDMIDNPHYSDFYTKLEIAHFPYSVFLEVWSDWGDGRYGEKNINDIDFDILREYISLWNSDANSICNNNYKYKYSNTLKNNIKSKIEDINSWKCIQRDISEINGTKYYLISGGIDYADEFEYAFYSVCKWSELKKTYKKARDISVGFGTNQEFDFSKEEVQSYLLTCKELSKKEAEILSTVNIPAIDFVSLIN